MQVLLWCIYFCPQNNQQMAKSKHKTVITGPHIVVVDAGKFPQAHIQPAGNRKSVESYNAKLSPEKRQKIFDYDESHPELAYYINKAAGRDAKTSDNAANEFATNKIIAQNEKLQKTAESQAEEIKLLKKQLAEKNKADATSKGAVKTPQPEKKS